MFYEKPYLSYLYPEVYIRPKFNLDHEVESIDVIVDNQCDVLHCEEFILNDVSEPVGPEKRFEAQRRVALRELTAGIYNEHGNPIPKKDRK
jgi:hypothetical protein